MKKFFLFVVILICLYLVSCSSNNNPQKMDDMDDKDVLTIEKISHSGVGTPEEYYYCTILNDTGAIRLTDYTDRSSALTGKKQTWKYNILGEKEVYLLWEYGEVKDSPSERYIEKYKIESRWMNNKKEFFYNVTTINTGVLFIESINGNEDIEGYYIDSIGLVSAFHIKRNALTDDSLDGIYCYWTNNCEKQYDNSFMHDKWYYRANDSLLFESELEIQESANVKSDGKGHFYYMISQSSEEDDNESRNYYEIAEINEKGLENKCMSKEVAVFLKNLTGK